MTWQPRDQRDSAEADRRARPRHFNGCKCFHCQPDVFRRELAELKAENDRLNRPSPPLGRYVRKMQ